MNHDQKEWLIGVVNAEILRYSSYTLGLDDVLATRIVDALIKAFSKEQQDEKANTQ